MSRDELIERLAEVAHRRQWAAEVEFEDASVAVRMTCREAVAWYVPAVVAFVEEWIGEYAPYEVEPGWLAHKWREAMG